MTRITCINFGARLEWVVNATCWSLYPQESDPIPIVQGFEWAPRTVWTVEENLATTGIRCKTIQPVAIRYPSTLSQSIRERIGASLKVWLEYIGLCIKRSTP